MKKNKDIVMYGNPGGNPKAFGTLTRSSPLVALQFRKLQAAGAVATQPTETWKPPVELPAAFDGRVTWRNYLTPIRNQGRCGSCFAFATVDCLTDRYNLYTLGQMRPNILSADSLTICMYTNIRDAEDFQKAFRDAQTAAGYSKEALQNNACHGSSLYEAARFCYFQGVPYETCIGENSALLGRKLRDFSERVQLPSCEALQGLQHTHCADQRQAMRVFRARTFAAIAGVSEDGGSVDLLKFVLFRFGPIASGFDVYDDFLNHYDGKTLYSGGGAGNSIGGSPNPSEAQPLGGHAVRIVGWDPEGWIIANSWGTDWGDHGYFRMKYGTCNLEKNVVVCAPDVPGYEVPDSDFAKILLTTAEQHIKDTYVIDPVTRYPVAALKQIASGQLHGELTPVFNPDFALYRSPAHPKPSDLFLAARDVPETPPTVPRLPAVPLHVLLQEFHVSGLPGNWVLAVVILVAISASLVLWSVRKPK